MKLLFNDKVREIIKLNLLRTEEQAKISELRKEYLVKLYSKKE